MFSKFYSFAVLLVVAMLVTACQPVIKSTAEAQPTAASVSEAITFTDALHQQVSIHSPVHRIVSLAPSVTESLFAIGAGGQVVGRTNFCDYPEEVRKLPSIGGFSASSISVESIIALKPDLVIGGSTVQAEVILAVKAAGIPAFISQPESLAEIMDALILFGQITDHRDTATTVVNQMQTRIETVKETVSRIPTKDRPTVFYEVWHEPLMSATRKSSIGELIEIAGGINIFGDLPDAFPTVNAEQILNADPDFIIGPSNHSDQLTADAIRARAGWQDLRAVKNNAIYMVDGNIISRPGPRMVDALEELAHILHPDLFKN
jgi:iron complex transport system substrate-binding protein